MNYNDIAKLVISSRFTKKWSNWLCYRNVTIQEISYRNLSECAGIVIILC